MKISELFFNTLSEYKYMVEMAKFNVQWAITPKVGKAELRFVSSACRLMELEISKNFHQISEMVSNLQSGHYCLVEMAIFNIYYVQRAVTPKVGQPELWFLCSARRVMVLYTSLCEISWKYLKLFSTYRTGMSTWWKWLCSMFKEQ